jgi:hypothetical protein
MEEPPIGVERHSVGAAHRRSLGRSSRGVPPPFQTCHRRFQQWVRSGVTKGILEALASELKLRCVIDVQEAFIDATFAPAKKGLKVGKTKRGKGTKIMAVADRHGLRVSICIESATPHEVKLATSTLVQMVVHDAPRNLIGDNAYDSDKLDDELRCYGIKVIARTGVTEELRHKTNAVCGDTVDAGKSRDYLPGCRTFGGSLSDMSVTLKTSSECFTWLAASFC